MYLDLIADPSSPDLDHSHLPFLQKLSLQRKLYSGRQLAVLRDKALALHAV